MTSTSDNGSLSVRDLGCTSSAMPDFDVEIIRDEALRIEFRHLARRAEAMAQGISASIGHGRKPVRFSFVDESEFNATAGVDDRSYQIGMNAAVPLLSNLLFYRLLSEPSVLPDLDTAGPASSNFAVPFIVDPSNFSRRADWRIETSSLRSFAAGTMADACSTFVLCHEFGHILLGHVEGIRYHYAADELAEFVKIESSGLTTMRRQAWEFDADQVAARLMMQFIRELVAIRETNERANAAFSDVTGGAHLEYVLGVCIAAIFALFVYLQAFKTKLSRFSSHPHPFVRARYLEEMLVQVAVEDAPIDEPSLTRLRDLRMAEFTGALAKVDLIDPATYTRRYVRDAEREIDRLRALSAKHDGSCRRWRWIG